MWTVLFWLGFVVLVGHAGVLAVNGGAYVTALVALAGALAMFFGSKVGREFLGISAA
jgi:hypothetical protein